MRLVQQRAVVTGDPANDVRIDANAVIRENGEGGDMLNQLHVRGAERQRQIWRQRSGDAEPVRHIHDGIDADFFREFYGGEGWGGPPRPARREEERGGGGEGGETGGRAGP